MHWEATNMNKEYLNKLMIREFPNLKEKYLDETIWQEGDSTGSHVVYGDVFTPYAIECILKDDDTEIKKVFQFVEVLLQSNDRYIEEVIAFSVIESMLYLFNERKKLKDYLGCNTLELLYEMSGEK
jgi:hypothetical protein